MIDLHCLNHLFEYMFKSSFQVKPSSWYLDAADGPWNVVERLKEYKPKSEKEIQGPALRER